MPVLTPWGYDVEDLPPLVTPDQLAQATAGRFGPGTIGVFSTLAGVSAAVRSACGWHVAPSLPCTIVTQGPGRVIALPALMVSSVSSVEELGSELAAGEYEWRRDGVLRRCCWRSWPSSFGSVRVSYEAGFEPDAAADLVTVVAQVAANHLAAPAGVRAEQAGDVSITYNQTGVGTSGGVRLLDSDLAMLAPYILDRPWS